MQFLHTYLTKYSGPAELDDKLKFFIRPPSVNRPMVADIFAQICTHTCNGWSMLFTLDTTNMGYLGPMLIPIIGSKKVSISNIYQLILYIYNIR